MLFEESLLGVGEVYFNTFFVLGSSDILLIPKKYTLLSRVYSK